LLNGPASVCRVDEAALTSVGSLHAQLFGESYELAGGAEWRVGENHPDTVQKGRTTDGLVAVAWRCFRALLVHPWALDFIGVGMTTAFVASSCSILLMDNRPKAGSVSATVGIVREQCARAQIHVVARHRQPGLEEAPLRKLHLDSPIPSGTCGGMLRFRVPRVEGQFHQPPCFLRMGACGVAPSFERPSMQWPLGLGPGPGRVGQAGPGSMAPDGRCRARSPRC
jgi:hypothetical protein